MEILVIATLVTSPEILILGVAVIASVKKAVIVTVSDAAIKLSASVSDKITDTLELHTPHSGCLEASFLQVALALNLKREGSLLNCETHHPERS